MHALAMASIAISAALPGAPAVHLEAGPSDGGIIVNVFRTGLFAAFAHDHHFEVTDWRATAVVPEGDASAASVHVVLAADSLRDTQRRLSDADRRKVNAQAGGPSVLDAAHHPRIEFRSERIELATARGAPGAVRGTIHGTLTLRARSVPTDVSFAAERASDGWHVRGTARVKQTDFGIAPFHGFGGTVGVKNDMTVDIAITLRPVAR